VLWKIFPAVLVVFLVARREWRALAACAAAALGIVLVTLPLTGTGLWGDWLGMLVRDKSGALAAFRAQSIAGNVALLSWRHSDATPLFHAPLAAMVLRRGLEAAALLLAALAVRRRVDRESALYPLQFGALLLLGVLFTPQAWDHYGVYLLPAYGACFAAAPPSARMLPLALGASFSVWAFTMQFHDEYEALAHGWRVLLLPAKLYASFVLLAVCAYLGSHRRYRPGVASQT
jgi:alpha-1,2-mannosyltransferase